MGKILEKLIYSRLASIVEDKQLLPRHQFGFLCGHSTIQQAVRTKQFLINNKKKRKSVGVVLLDIEKAFDSIWHDGLIFKLIEMKLPTYLVRIIQAFIRNQRFAVYVNGCKSEEVNIPAGLAQRTCISPLLYALYVADMPSDININTALFADDTALATAANRSNTIIKRLNKSLETHTEYFSKWKIKINTNKTQAIIFPFDNKRRRVPTVTLKSGSDIIKLSKSVKYLGVIFDSKLKFGEHVSHAVHKSNKCFRALYTLLTPKSRLSTDNKKLIYTAVIRSIMMYGSPVWSTAAKSHLKKLSTLQNKVLKHIFNLHRRTPTNFLHDITGICNLSEFIETTQMNFTASCRNSEFDLIREIERM